MAIAYWGLRRVAVGPGKRHQVSPGRGRQEGFGEAVLGLQLPVLVLVQRGVALGLLWDEAESLTELLGLEEGLKVGLRVFVDFLPLAGWFDFSMS